ncbi:Emp70p [Kluyveromyces lactis]|uniref:Transmembrane 9 superfamily member n=1 Tax=Kluyveromyces lactis (strain ATCC 8585 / CBS 2359 / DSM 70799 / NBRC 1267 / NRRL Y-1140 / WM37) TaxID=284590 RepID=Q6CJG0_KLULA|nr:uncharacterized protein KLLA0_F18931g [Kluyveromyces lactis]CAG98637.1 KLLA0F18931p [Kluyveromyces lactis]|eukprot:XP_455929.1 uncharacterized protein KLLA0_F18931g [Kluyveromyces lactis]
MFTYLWRSLLVSTLIGSLLVEAFYLPGVAPTTYHEGDDLPLLVNHLTPSQFYKHYDTDQHDTGDKEGFLYSYDYYYKKFHFCQPAELKKQPESLGSIIFGDRIYNSPFKLQLLKNVECQSLCKSVIPGKDAKFINKLILNGFFQNWIIDGLPAARKMEDTKTNKIFYGNGFELGLVDVLSDYEPDTRSLHDELELQLNAKKNVLSPGDKVTEIPYFVNHYDIQIEYHDRGENNYRIVGVTVNPASIKRDSPDSCESTGKSLVLSETEDNEVYFTYSVKFIKSDTVWATRWDKYLHVYDPKIQWFSLINFSTIVVLLSSVMLHSLYSALKNDLARYNELNLDTDFEEETGWKLIHGDVFRSPNKALLLSVLVGSGGQLALMLTTTILFACLGFLSPSSRGSLSTVMFLLYAIFGSFGSFTSMATYKFFNGKAWRLNLVLTPLLVPGSILTVVLGLNFFLIFVHSSGAIPFQTMLVLVLLWFVISIPLSAIGSVIAWKKCNWNEHPTKTNQIARQIPFQPWYLKTIPVALLAGIFPFGSIAVELYFIYSSLWFNKIYYMFGFLFFSFILLALTTSLITVLLTYHSLCMENWKWQWRSFVIGGCGCAFYVFCHSILFTKFRLGGLTTIVLYLGYSILISGLCCLVTGAIGFLSSLILVRKIYSCVKVD